MKYGLCLVYACIQKDRTRLLVGTWWREKKTKQNKSKINLLNEKCSLVQRGGVRVPIWKIHFSVQFWGFPNCLDVVKGVVLVSPCSDDWVQSTYSFFKTKTFHSRLSFTVIFMDIAASQTSSCTAARLTPKWHRWVTLSRSDFFLGWCPKRLVLTSASTGP